MTPATLRTLREALGFTVEGLAAFLSVNRRTITRWESTTSTSLIPDDVADQITTLMDWVDDTVDATVDALEVEDPPEGTPIDLYRYVTADSAARAGVTVPWEVHCAALGRICGEVWGMGLTPVVHYIPIEA